MHLGRASAYGIIATAHIANEQSRGPVPGRQIAERRTIPPEYLLKILQQLVRAGILRAERGRKGGFLLRKPPELTTMLEVIEALDGPITGRIEVRDEILGAENVKDELETVCGQVAAFARSQLGEVTFARLVETGRCPTSPH